MEAHFFYSFKCNYLVLLFMASLTVSHCKGKFSNRNAFEYVKKTKVVLLSETLTMLKASQGMWKRKS